MAIRDFFDLLPNFVLCACIKQLYPGLLSPLFHSSFIWSPTLGQFTVLIIFCKFAGTTTCIGPIVVVDSQCNTKMVMLLNRWFEKWTRLLKSCAVSVLLDNILILQFLLRSTYDWYY